MWLANTPGRFGPGAQWRSRLAVGCIAALPAVAALAGLSGCGLGTAQPAPPPIDVAAVPEADPPPPTRQIEVVVDPSASVPRRYLKASLRALAGAVRAIPKALAPTGPSPARPAVAINVRAVAGDAYSPAARFISGTVAGVPAIAALPEDSEADLTSAAVAIGKQRQAAAKALATARSDANALAQQLASADPPVEGCSDVIGAVSASAQSFSSPDRRLLLITDLAQNCAANSAGSLHGARVLVVHICESAARCQEQQAAWRQRFATRGGSSPRFIRIENMGPALHDFIAGD